VKHLVAQNLLEDLARGRIIVHELPIQREAARGRLLRDMQKGQQPIVRLALDLQVVESVSAGQWIAVQLDFARSVAPAPQRSAAVAEQIAVVQFVDGMLEIQPAQERIGRDFGRPENVAAAIGLDFSKGQQLAHTAIRTRPDPLMQGPHQAVERATRVTPDMRPWGELA
jgi:hypothetical protein